MKPPVQRKIPENLLQMGRSLNAHKDGKLTSWESENKDTCAYWTERILVEVSAIIPPESLENSRERPSVRAFEPEVVPQQSPINQLTPASCLPSSWASSKVAPELPTGEFK